MFCNPALISEAELLSVTRLNQQTLVYWDLDSEPLVRYFQLARAEEVRHEHRR